MKTKTPKSRATPSAYNKTYHCYYWDLVMLPLTYSRATKWTEDLALTLKHSLFLVFGSWYVSAVPQGSKALRHLLSPQNWMLSNKIQSSIFEANHHMIVILMWIQNKTSVLQIPYRSSSLLVQYKRYETVLVGTESFYQDTSMLMTNWSYRMLATENCSTQIQDITSIHICHCQPVDKLTWDPTPLLQTPINNVS